MIQFMGVRAFVYSSLGWGINEVQMACDCLSINERFTVTGKERQQLPGSLLVMLAN